MKTPSHNNRRLKYSGFTLLEVMIALIVAALLLGGVYRTMSQQALERLKMNERFLGQTAAWNRLMEQYQVVQRWVPRGNELGRRNGKNELQGRDWYWELDAESTLGDNFFRYEVKVYAQKDDGSRPGDDAPSVASLVAFYIIE